MKRILTILMLACIVLVPSCKSRGKKAGENIQNGEKTLVELVQDVEEAPQMGIWKVADLHGDCAPTIEAQRVKDNEGKQTCWFTTELPSSSAFNVKLWGKFPTIEGEDYSCELHLKSNNQDEIMIYGNTEFTKKDVSFNKDNSKQIIRYMSEATSPVTLTFVGAPKNMTFEIPTEGFKEVCKCWYNALIEKGYDRCLK